MGVGVAVGSGVGSGVGVALGVGVGAMVGPGVTVGRGVGAVEPDGSSLEHPATISPTRRAMASASLRM